MSNEEIYARLREQFSAEDMYLFSLMESIVHSIKYKEDVKNGDIPSEHEYDAKWWLDKHAQLVKHEYENRGVIREQPKSN